MREFSQLQNALYAFSVCAPWLSQTNHSSQMLMFRSVDYGWSVSSLFPLCFLSGDLTGKYYP